jgi:hypothetical protein
MHDCKTATRAGRSLASDIDGLVPVELFARHWSIGLLRSIEEESGNSIEEESESSRNRVELEPASAGRR